MYLLELRNKRRIVTLLRKKIKSTSSKLTEKSVLSFDQKKEINSFFGKYYGTKVTSLWHEYFFRRNGIFSEKYIPTDLYYTSLNPKLNHYPYNEAYSDKCLTSLILPDVPQPKMLMNNTRGYFYIGRKAVSKEDAISFLQNLSDVIIKPTLAAHGEGVKKFSVKDGITSIDGLTVEQLFDKYQKDFCVQEVIHQHPEMSKLNPSSVNTIRVLTYRSKMEVLVCYAIVRIGRKGFDVDNESAGGMSVKVNDDGTLCKYAYGCPGDDNIQITDSGVSLEGYQIPSFDAAVRMVKDAHYSLPYFDLIGWDVAIQEAGDPILIEWNTWPELSQSAVGPAFGEYTERILTEIKDRKNTRNFYWG